MDQINREHILAAIQEIDREGIRPGRNSSTYDVIHEGKPYPPKLVISIANRFATGEELDSSIFSGGMDTPAFQLLKKEGFEIVSKRNDIQDLIRKYKKHILQTQLKDEKYKWELLHEFQGRPNIDAQDLLEEFKSIKYTNLIYAMGIAVLYHLLNAKPEEMRSLFRKLFDESNDLTQRIKSFNIESLALYRSLGETLQHHQDERTIASYLTFYNPEKYTFYKYSFYKKLCGLLNEKEAKKNEKYPHYLQLIHRLIEEYIQHDIELIELVKSYIPEYYDGSNNLLLTQDILYQMLDKNDDFQEINVKEEFANWFIANDGKISNYYSKQFGSKKERLTEELDLYEQEYKENFNTELFVIDAGNYKNQIERIKNNIYDKNANFSNYSKERSNDRPRAILGNNNYLKFLQERFNPKKYSNDEENFTASVEENNAQVYMQSNKEPLNQILYGPPGTGKTYNTINRSLSILEGKSQKEINLEARIDLKTRFDDYVKNGQIVFTTFHQSMSYEDFIEGIKPETKHEKVIYNVQDGILKKIIKTALIEYLEKGNSSDKEDSFDSLYKEYVNSIRSFEGKREGLFSTKTGVEIMLVDANDNSILVKYIWGDKKKGQEGKQVFTVSKEKLKKTLFEGIVPANVKNLKEQLHPLIGHIHCELFAVYKHFYDFVVTNKGEIDAVHYDYEDLSFKEVKEQYDLLDTYTLNNKVVKPYIIIIDEINRGNVSGIFGELITLIEDDKRLGKREALEVTLPYSKDRFGLPDNLFIIGTMNTADRSVEALDTALRRRFSFSEMMPKRELLEKIQFKGFNLSEVLKTINERIEVLLDRDHTIGHSYFLKIRNGDVVSLKSVFKNNIFPLLQEYFYHDYEKIALILGEGFVRVKKNQTVRFAKFNDINTPDIGTQFELIDKIEDIEGAVHLLLNRNV